MRSLLLTLLKQRENKRRKKGKFREKFPIREIPAKRITPVRACVVCQGEVGHLDGAAAAQGLIVETIASDL